MNSTKEIKVGIVRGNKIPEWELPIYRSLKDHNIKPILIGTAIPTESNGAEFRRVRNIRGNRTLNKMFLSSGFGKMVRYGLDKNIQEYASKMFLWAKLFDGVDVLHLVDEAYYPSFQAMKKVKKSAMTVWENIPYSFSIEKTAPTAKLKEKVFKQVDYFLPVSEEAKFSLLWQGIDESKIFKIHPGIDISKIRGRKENPSIYNTMKAPKDCTIILGVGRMEYFKGLTYILRALKKLKMESSKVKYFHLGSGNPKFSRYIMDMVKNLGLEDVFEILGSVRYSDIFDYYANADLFLLPSITTMYWEEQMGFSILEAMASGTIPIVSDIPTLEEVVPDDTGIRIPAGNADRLKEAINTFNEDKDSFSSMIKNGIQHVEDNYNSIKSAEQYSSIYRQLFSETR